MSDERATKKTRQKKASGTDEKIDDDDTQKAPTVKVRRRKLTTEETVPEGGELEILKPTRRKKKEAQSNIEKETYVKNETESKQRDPIRRKIKTEETLPEGEEFLKPKRQKKTGAKSNIEKETHHVKNEPESKQRDLESDNETQEKMNAKQKSNRNRPAKNTVKEEIAAVTSSKKGTTKTDGAEKSKSKGTQAKRNARVKENKSAIKSKVTEAPVSGQRERAKCVGAHVSISGGLYRAVDEAVAMGARAFGMFLKSQRQWAAKPLADADAAKFREACQVHGFPPHLILPHGSYLMNCGSPSEETLQKSRNALVDELERCEKLGLSLFNFHPGSTCGEISVEECLKRIAESINLAHAKIKYVIVVLENMCCQGNTVGGKFEELRGIINQVNDKSRIGVCLDTCHAYAAGHNLATEDGLNTMLCEFDDIVGLKYLKAMHLNDSKDDTSVTAACRMSDNGVAGTVAPISADHLLDCLSWKLGCHLDRHENIGKGSIGKIGFRKLMNDPRLNNIPMILETPCPEGTTYAKEVKMLYGMCDK